MKKTINICLDSLARQNQLEINNIPEVESFLNRDYKIARIEIFKPKDETQNHILSIHLQKKLYHFNSTFFAAILQNVN